MRDQLTMAGAIYNSKTGYAALFAAMSAMAACSAANDQPTDQTEDQAAGQPAVSESLTVSSEGETSSDPKPIAAVDILRPANFYQLEWDDTAALCVIALDALNKPYALPSHLRTMPDGVAPDYASKQAARFLGSDDNLRWEWVVDDAARAGSTETAKFDYFNDGTEHTVVRTRGQLAGNSIVGLAIADNDSGDLTRLNFGHAGAVVENLPDQVNLHTKLTYSVADVIRLGGNYYTLLMPLEDFDKSGRVYLATWRSKEGGSASRLPRDYYPQVACVFRAAGAPSLDLK